MSKPDTWMPLYVGDYLRDTMHLTAEQHGHYLLAIIAYWTRGGPLPDDDEILSEICKMRVKNRQNSLMVLRQFFVRSNAELRHRRIDAELAHARDKSEQAKTAVLTRYRGKRPTSVPTDVPTPVSTSVPTDASTDDLRNAYASPSPHPLRGGGAPPVGGGAPAEAESAYDRAKRRGEPLGHVAAADYEIRKPGPIFSPEERNAILATIHNRPAKTPTPPTGDTGRPPKDSDS